MNPRLIIFAIGLTFVTCLGPATMLVDITRKQAYVLLGLLSLLVLAVFGLQTESGFALWSRIEGPTTMVPILVSLLAGSAAFAFLDARRARRRRLSGRWTDRPSEEDFGTFCVAELEARGWEAQTQHRDLRFSICRMEQYPRRITAIMLSRSRAPNEVANMLTRLRWKPYGRTVLVLRDTPLPDFVAHARLLGWSVLRYDHLDGMAEAYAGHA